tara:strand:+ start:963 stop:2366 length:1404 start_codon:yes stop_codon:yes gene_type:complete
MSYLENSFKNTNFHWFTGVVEDINDPTEMGRVKVRCYGYHTEDKSAVNGIPVSALPWAHVLMPVTSAACSGVGESATGLVQGSWVVGFFRDGCACQDPLIMGSLPSQTTRVKSSRVGFQDPDGDHPRDPEIVDNPKQSTGDFMRSKSFKKKVQLRQQARNYESAEKSTDIPIAIAPNTSQLIEKHGKDDKAEGPYFDRTYFLHPDPEDTNEPVYPHNHVKEYASGHVVEFDDTEDEERISIMHRSGTYEEIDSSGTKTTIVVGDGYEVHFRDRNINVKGNCNLTIEGDCRTLVKGSEYREIQGDYHLKVKGNVHTKIGLSNFYEIGRDEVGNIARKVLTTIGKDERRINMANYQHEIKGNSDLTTVGNKNERVDGTCDTAVIGNCSYNITDAMTLSTQGNLNLVSLANIDMDAAVRMDVDAPTGSIDYPAGNITTTTGTIVSNGKVLETHTHTDTTGTGAGTTSGPN